MTITMSRLEVALFGMSAAFSKASYSVTFLLVLCPHLAAFWRIEIRRVSFAFSERRLFSSLS